MQCCGSGMFIPDPGSWFLSIPDPGSQILNPKSWIPDLGSQISDPLVQLAQLVVRRPAVRQARVQFSAGHTGFGEWWRMNKCMIVLCEWMLKTKNIKMSGIMATIKIFFCFNFNSNKYHTLYYYFLYEQVKKKCGPIFKELPIELFTKKICY